jgi:hypothetical protein
LKRSPKKQHTKSIGTFPIGTARVGFGWLRSGHIIMAEEFRICHINMIGELLLIFCEKDFTGNSSTWKFQYVEDFVEVLAV